MDTWVGLAALLLIWGLSLILVLYPAKVVQWHASVNRKLYERLYKKVDRELIDRTQMPWEAYLLGSKAEYLIRAPKDPGHFPRAIWFVRSLGLLFIIGATVLLLLSMILAR